MIRTTQNLFCITSLVILSACSKQTDITPENDESLVTEDTPDEEPLGVDEDEDDPPPTESQSGDEGEGSDPEAPEEEEGDSGGAVADDSADEEAGEEPAGGSYAGDLTVIINTTFGPDTCAGSALVDVSEEGSLNGSGACSFEILGAQSPALVGSVAEDGSVTGTVGLTAFGTSFTLAWNGVQDATTLVASHNGTDSLVGVGDITYEVIIDLEIDASTDAEDSIPEGTTDAYVDYSEHGEDLVLMSSGTYTSTDGCDLSYELYSPDEAVTDTLTVIQHGFARSMDEFAQLANHLASRGLPALTMDLCHSWAFDVDINQNAADVVDLVENLWEGPVLYVGHSNGAMSSLVAASIDDQAVAVLGLDPVERPGGDHTDIAGSIGIPVLGIFGEAGVCNSWNSGIDAFMAVPDSDLFRTTEADHCDFEVPTGTVCTLACAGSNDIFSDETIRSNIVTLGTAYISWHSTGDEDALEWTDPAGGARAELVAMGAISSL